MVFGYLQVCFQFDGTIDVMVGFEVFKEINDTIEIGGISLSGRLFEVNEVFEKFCLHILKRF